MEVLDNIKQAIELLKEVEEYNEKLNGENGLISICDKKIDFWEHYLELEDLKVTESYNINKEMKKQRLLRRRYKNDAEIIKLFKDNESKMANAGHRSILLAQLCKTDNRQKNLKYSYNAYTEEEVEAILRPKKKFSAIVSKLTFKLEKKENENEKTNGTSGV